MKISSETINFKPWTSEQKPERILAIRLQAMGDAIITLPYLQSLKNHLPQARLDLLTTKEVDSIPKEVRLFEHVYSLAGGRDFKGQALHALFMLPKLWKQHYDVVIDLQRNRLTRWIRRLLRPRCWSEFDRFSPIPGGERTRLTLEALYLGGIGIAPLSLKNNELGLQVLRAAGWKEEYDLLVLNPAGHFANRNWPLHNYVDFSRLWLDKYNPKTQFLAMGLPDVIGERAAFLKEELGDAFINLVGQTTASEAFSIIRHATLTLSEDSALMHMSWINGRPTLGLFGSSRSYWSRPVGEFSVCLDSSDLECGDCYEPTCKYGDNRCLTRYSPEMVFETARGIQEKERQSESDSPT
ncbi:MAG: glycosyltransferase family 9 protein [Planctomycetota bacterium]